MTPGTHVDGGPGTGGALGGRVPSGPCPAEMLVAHPRAGVWGTTESTVQCPGAEPRWQEPQLGGTAPWVPVVKVRLRFPPVRGSELYRVTGQAVPGEVAHDPPPKTAGTEPLPPVTSVFCTRPFFPPRWGHPGPQAFLSGVRGSPHGAQALVFRNGGQNSCGMEDAGCSHQNSLCCRPIGLLPPQRDLCLKIAR